jgi:hypothetical protein
MARKTDFLRFLRSRPTNAEVLVRLAHERLDTEPLPHLREVAPPRPTTFAEALEAVLGSLRNEAHALHDYLNEQIDAAELH